MNQNYVSSITSAGSQWGLRDALNSFWMLSRKKYQDKWNILRLMYRLLRRHNCGKSTTSDDTHRHRTPQYKTRLQTSESLWKNGKKINQSEGFGEEGQSGGEPGQNMHFESRSFCQYYFATAVLCQGVLESSIKSHLSHRHSQYWCVLSCL